MIKLTFGSKYPKHFLTHVSGFQLFGSAMSNVITYFVMVYNFFIIRDNFGSMVQKIQEGWEHCLMLRPKALRCAAG